MSQTATPSSDARPRRSQPHVTTAAAVSVSAGVFAMVLLVMGYALLQGLKHDEASLAAEAREQVRRGEAVAPHVVHASTPAAPGQAP